MTAGFAGADHVQQAFAGQAVDAVIGGFRADPGDLGHVAQAGMDDVALIGQKHQSRRDREAIGIR
ncbi:hypothetical protein P7L78_00015 (plasmid) [Tistrella bauzanensis]|uniref:Uncharacterized protein n=1 Tax=Tistrella arctica TaxID=3133430 RepID=A0ABU9YL47_9PROT